MGWEERHGKRYYYRKVWANGSCVSQYVGAGPVAEAIGQLTQLDQQRLKFERDVSRAEQADIAALDSQVDKFCAFVGQVVIAVLLATGHHQHKRQWRKQRMGKSQKDDPNAFLMRLQKGHGADGDIQKFKEAITEVPEVLELFNLAKNAQEQVIEGLSGDNQALKFANLQIVENIRRELGYNDASILEKLIIEQITLCYVRLYWVEGLFTQGLKNGSAWVAHGEKRLSINQRRYFRAIETLARVRRLARRTPDIFQINLAKQQLNLTR
jgi:hypothetical protein